MKASEECYECLHKLAVQAANFASDDENLVSTATEACIKILRDDFSTEKISIVIAAKMHDAIKLITSNTDPYRAVKDQEIETARQLYEEIKSSYKDSFEDYIKIAALGNALDFFRPIEAAKADMRRKIEFVIDDSREFEVKMKRAMNVLYLADNAGEVYFDIPLLRWMKKFSAVTYVVKAAPVQNDITLQDIRYAGLEYEVGGVITTGTATPGIDFNQASDDFKAAFESADFVFAKGMGYYETLSELPPEGRVFYCLKAKCQPVADSLEVPLNSYVAMLR